MEIIRNDDGTLTVPVEPDRQAVEAAAENGETLAATTMTLHPGEGGYDEALSEWDLQQHDGQVAVSTASGRDAAMHVIHEVAADPDIDIADAVEELDDPTPAPRRCATSSSGVSIPSRTSRPKWPTTKAVTYCRRTR